MRRTFLLTLIAVFFLSVCASAREAEPYRAAQGPDGKKPPADSRGKIIDELRADYNDVVDEFARKNVNDAMCAKQQRIIDNLKRLLEDEDPPPPNPSGSVAPENSAKSPPPSGSKANSPAPKPSPDKLPALQPMPDEKGESETPARTVEGIRKEKSRFGPWPPLPPRQREAIDAHSRDRFPPRYEELLRAYYRTIAESGRRDAHE